MSVRFNTLTNLLTFSFVKKTPVFLLLLLFCPLTQKSQGLLEDVKKEANKLFEDDQFTEAYKLYSQLVANYPKDPEYNYRLGVCMIYAEPDKKKCIPYLKSAASNTSKESPKDVNFYLGKAYHINYLFDDAIRYYEEFKKNASASLQKKLQVDREIKACQNGKRLLSNLTDLVVQNKKSLNEVDYYRSYDLKTIGGKLLVKPDEFKTSADKKKKEKSVVFLPKGGSLVYFSSYGDNADNGKDIYTVARLPGGGFGKPEKVKGINTEFDEDYPFLHPDGKTLYFASKGHNSMGGYDIFKSRYMEETGSWSPPENLEFPINSPDDDFLFVTDSLEKTAYFSTGRQSPPGKIDVLKINTERKPIDILVIKGAVLKASDDQSLRSSISIKNQDNGQSVGTFEAGENGDYTLDLPNGAKLLFTVETPGFKVQSEEISLPLATVSKPYKQTIAYEEGVLRIRNQFDEEGGDDNYLQYLKIIEKKAKLEVNEGQNQLSVPPPPDNSQASVADSSVAVKPKKENRPQVVSEEPGQAVSTTNPTAPPAGAAKNQPNGLDNKELAKMARQDAEESQQEAAQMKRDAQDAFETGRKQKEEAGKKLAEAEEAIKNAESITNEEEKNNVLSKANQLKRSAQSDQVIAEKIISYAESLEKDAAARQKEAELNRQYALELEKNAGSKNKQQSQARIEELQKQISNSTGQKIESENIVNEIKSDIEQKENQLARIEKINGDVKSNLDEVKTEIGNKETELAKTKKKSQKEEIGKQLDELKADQADKEKQIASNDAEIGKLNDELNTLKNELELTTRIKTEEIAVTAPSTTNEPTSPVATDNGTNKRPPANTAIANEKINPAILKEKYNGKTIVSDPSDKTALEESNTHLKEYNREIDRAQASNKALIAKIKNQQAKQRFINENKQYETQKKQNLQQLAANTARLEALNKPIVSNTGTTPTDSKNNFSPITANSSTEAVVKLDNLEKQLSFNDGENFDFNAYQNPKAQALKVEADARINDAVARQKKLKDEISSSKNSLQTTGQENNGTPATVRQNNSEQLIKEADDFHNQAIAKLNESKTKEGAEKEQLMVESRALEEKSNEKHLEVADITRTENSGNFNANKDNIEALIKEKKSGDADLAEARRLSDEASTAFKQAQGIRAETAAQTSTGAKLGIVSNAEEKEAEAILKQQQAIDLLKKSNPDFVLKTATQANQGSQVGSENVNARLETVNSGLNELANIKIESYQKLGEANNTEAEELDAAIRGNQSSLDNNPSLKSEYIAASNKLQAAKALRQKSDSAGNQGEKLNLLISSVKKQNEAIKQLNTLNASVAREAANKPENPVANEPVTTTNPQNTVSAQPPVTENAGNENNGGNTTTGNEKPATQEASPATATTQPVASDNEPLDKQRLEELAKNDTTTGHVISYFNDLNPSLKNPQANNILVKSLNQLKNFEADVASIEAKLNAPDENTANEGESSGVTAAELKSKSETLMVEGDELSTKAMQTRKEAESKEGAEKEALLSDAKELEGKALDKSIEAAVLLFRSNEIDVAGNSAAIDDLMGRLRNDNPELSVELASKREEQINIRGQIQKLRSEAESQTNKAAKLGVINNAEERELELIQKQEQLLGELKKLYPDYTVKQFTSADLEKVPVESKESLSRKKAELRGKQFNELTNLTNAFSLEFESSKNNVPKKLDATQQKTRQNALDLNAESKRLLVKSAQEKNEGEKMKLLSRSVKLGSEAIGELNKIIPANAVAANTQKPVNNSVNELDAIGNRIKENNRNNASPENASAPGAETKNQVRIEGLEVRRGNAYNETRPIPINAKIQDGLIFRVQIGAFKTQLPNDAFKGLNPLNGETTPNGYFRYTAGNFNKIENANAVKNDLRGLGYSDAFVVAYYNGKRITLAEAIELLNKEGRPIDVNAPQSAGITANVNVPRAAVNPAAEKPAATKELEKVNGLLYTIQIGVYNRQVSPGQLRNLRPIFTEQIPGGLFRYTAGIYNNTERLLSDKGKVIELGVKDAFVSAYLNGKKIPFAEAKKRQVEDAAIKMEAEEPIIFPGAGAPASTGSPTPTASGPANIQPFTNGVNSYPASSPDNGVKQTEEGICYKVQIGAYSKQVPNDVAAKFLAIKTWPIENKQANGLFIYNIGNFVETRFAKALKEEAIKLGLTDVFITVYKDGKKLYGDEAATYLGR